MPDGVNFILLGHGSQMKKFIILVAAFLFAVFGIVDIVHDLIANDPVHYFSERPHQFLLLATVVIIGGVIAIFFSQLPGSQQKTVKIFTLGLVASLVTVCGYYCEYYLIRSSIFGAQVLTLLFLSVTAMAIAFWFEFYRAYRN